MQNGHIKGKQHSENSEMIYLPVLVTSLIHSRHYRSFSVDSLLTWFTSSSEERWAWCQSQWLFSNFISSVSLKFLFTRSPCCTGSLSDLQTQRSETISGENRISPSFMTDISTLLMHHCKCYAHRINISVWWKQGFKSLTSSWKWSQQLTGFPRFLTKAYVLTHSLCKFCLWK